MSRSGSAAPAPRIGYRAPVSGGEPPKAGAAMNAAVRAIALAWRESPWTLGLSVLISLAAGISMPIAAWETKAVLDAISGPHPGGLPVRAAVLVCVAGIVSTVLPVAGNYLQGAARRTIALRVQDQLFRAVNRFQGLARFEDPAFQDRLRMAQLGGLQAPSQLVNSIVSLLRSAMTIVGFVAGAAAVSPPAAVLVVAAAVPGMYAQLVSGRRRVQGVWRNGPALRRRMLAQSLLADPRAVKEVRAFGLGDFFRERVHRDQRLINSVERSIELRVVRTQALSGAAGALLTAAVTAWALWRAASGQFSVGDVTVLLAGTAGVQGALTGSAGSVSDAHTSAVMYAGFREVVSAGPDLPVPVSPRRPGRLEQGIELRDVWFRYSPTADWVLRGVDLRIPAGQATAVVGENGAGKSTLVKLLCRMYEPERGMITWDGTDIRLLDPAALRRRVGVLFQDYMTYAMTAAENIGVGEVSTLEPGPPDLGRIRAAAHAAGIDAELAALPDGYDTMLGRMFAAPGASSGPTPAAGAASAGAASVRRSAIAGPVRSTPGTSLSGGQWQRVALARALLRGEADLLVLDEPSSGLDAVAEGQIHTRIGELRAGRTSLLISHRLAAVRAADQIVVLREGRIVERGDHEGLMLADGVYAQLFRTQAAGYQLTPADPSGGRR